VNSEAWQTLLSLESRDVVAKWFKEIHKRELNDRRSKEIMAAARQAREFFRNSANSNFSVKPLLTFYGVASLSRSLALLFRKDGGEESLASGHGLETYSCSTVLSCDVSAGLSNIGDLKVRSCAGLFDDLVKATENTMTIHIRSSAVDWRIPYSVPSIGMQLQLKDLFVRLPDLAKAYSTIASAKGFGSVNEMTFTDQTGLMAKIICNDVSELRSAYTELGYQAEHSDKTLTLQATNAIFQSHNPQFAHAYVDKMFGSIPHLYIVTPFPNGFRYSQLAMTYVLSYILGMLARYFPTHWIALVQGEKGDGLWPTINRAHHLVEHSFPELVSELIAEALNRRKLQAETSPANQSAVA
jgi:hypothetical protein